MGDRLRRALDPASPPPGPFRREFWRSPMRGPWLSSFLGSALLPLIAVCAITGFLSHSAYYPELGDNSIIGPGGAGFDLYFWSWPTTPSWLYALTQGLHVGAGLAAIPILLAKLWSAMPRLFEWPAVRSPAHLLDRISLAMLVGGSLFVFFTGIFNIQNWYPWGFSFLAAHYYGAYVFLAGLAVHLVTKIPVALRAFRDRGFVRPLRDDLAHTEPEPPREGTTAPVAAAAPTISRRGLLATIGAGSLGLAFIAAAQSIGGPLRPLALLAPRGGELGSGPNEFPVNKTAAAAGIAESMVDAGWGLTVRGPGGRRRLARSELEALSQTAASLPIACVEGWSTTQDWEGVSLRDLAALVGADPDGEVLVESLQRGGSFRSVTLSPGQAADSRTLLALRVNGAEISLDHGYPARLVVPAAPGVHCTKWVGSVSFPSATASDA